MHRIAAILPAAGMGTRMGAETPKQFLELDGTPIVIHSLRRIASCALVTDIIVATRADEVARLEERIAKEKFKQTVRVVKGGDSRQESVAAALNEVPVAAATGWTALAVVAADEGALTAAAGPPAIRCCIATISWTRPATASMLIRRMGRSLTIKPKVRTVKM